MQSVWGFRGLTCTAGYQAPCPLFSGSNSTAAAETSGHSSPDSEWTPATHTRVKTHMQSNHMVRKLLSNNQKCKKSKSAVTNSLPQLLMLFISFLSWPFLPFPPLLLHSLICSLSICVFAVSTNHRLLKTKANPRPEIKSAWESPRCAALIHFSYPRGTSKSPSINREAALS